MCKPSIPYPGLTRKQADPALSPAAPELVCPATGCGALLSFSSRSRRIACLRCGAACDLTDAEARALARGLSGAAAVDVSLLLTLLHPAVPPPASAPALAA